MKKHTCSICGEPLSWLMYYANDSLEVTVDCVKCDKRASAKFLEFEHIQNIDAVVQSANEFLAWGRGKDE